MISVGFIREKLEKLIQETSKFIVDVQVSPSNDIYIELDDEEKFIAVEDCIAVSKGLENQLDRESEDFSLQVSSPGLSNPFKVKRQYFKNIGRELKVLKTDGIVIKGLLEKADEDQITLSRQVKERIEGRRAKQMVTHQDSLKYDEIKETTIIISFK